MQLTIKLNLDVLKTKSYQNSFLIEFNNITDMQNYADQSNVTAIEYTYTSSPSGHNLDVYINGEYAYSKTTNFVTDLSATGNYIQFTCDIPNNSYNILKQLIDNGVIELIQDGITTFIVFKQNSENDTINKTLTFVDTINGKFNSSINLKNIVVDIYDYQFNFNYVYIPILKRYYYVDSIDLISADITRLHLKEDVLMSWKDLIMQQKAFITRYGGSTEKYLDDNRRPLQDVSDVEYITITPTTQQNSKVNIELRTTFNDNDLIFLVNTKSIVINLTHYDTTSPDSSNLLDIDSIESNRDSHYLLSMNDMGAIVNACINNDVPVSSIVSILFLPFTTTLLQPAPNNILYAGNYKLADDGTWDNLSSGTPKTPKYVNQVYYGNSPYFVLADFKLDITDDSYLNHKPYSYYEMYIAFVGWISLDIEKCIDNTGSPERLLLYYSLDYQSGIATAYLYNFARKMIIWSGSCQMGIKMDITTSNLEENTKQKQASNLNMILSLFASSGAIIGGAYMGNPLSMFGGLMSGTKAIASNIMTHQTIFDRIQTTFGTPISTLYTTSLGVRVVRTSRKKLFTDTSGEYTNYKHIQGLPYNHYELLNNLDTTYYCEVGEIHFDPKNTIIYQDEIDEIVSLLKNGVIL